MVRPRTAAGGVALGGVLLLALTMAGSGAGPPAHSGDPALERQGPRSAVQPARPPDPSSDEADRGRSAVAAIPSRPDESPPAEPVVEPAADPGATAGGLCRALFEEPASLPARWGLPAEHSQTHAEPDWAIRGFFTVSTPVAATAGFARLRELAADCGHFTATLPDGTAVTVRLTEPEPGLPELSGIDASYGLRIVTEAAGPPQLGWLAVDRVGPVVSVLWQLAPATDPERTARMELALHARRAALAWWSELLPADAAPGTGAG